MRVHVPRILGTFSSIGPFFASVVLIAAVFAETARFGTIGDHVSAAVVAFSSGSPSSAGIIFVFTIGSC